MIAVTELDGRRWLQANQEKHNDQDGVLRNPTRRKQPTSHGAKTLFLLLLLTLQ